MEVVLLSKGKGKEVWIFRNISVESEWEIDWKWGETGASQGALPKAWAQGTRKTWFKPSENSPFSQHQKVRA